MSGANVASLDLARNRFRAALSAPSSLFAQQAVDPFFAYIGQMADPDEILRRAGVARASLRALSGDDEISTALDTRREALLGTPWRLEDGGETLSAQSEFIRQTLEPHVEKMLGACMEALPYGYSVQEAIYVALPPGSGGTIGLAEITEKPFEWFIPRLDGTVLYKTLSNPQGIETDPRKYFLTARRQTYRNPYGEALFSRLYWPWLFRSQGWRFWVKWLERFGTPMLVGETQGDAKAMATALASAVQDAVAAVGMGDKVSIAEAKGQGGAFEGFERATCARIQKLILGQTLTTDSGGSSGSSGSYALGNVHNEVRIDRRNADIRMCRGVVQRLIGVLWALNKFTPGKEPKFVLEDDTGLEADRAERDAKLGQYCGVHFTTEYLTRVYDFEDGDIEVPDPNEAPPAAPGGNAPTPAARASSQRFTPQQQVVEDGVAKLLLDAPTPLEVRKLRSAVLGAKDFADVAARLALLVDDQAPEYRELLARAQFAATVLGFVHASEAPAGA